MVGYPDSIAGSFIFTPLASENARNPLFNGQACFGKDYRELNPVPAFSLTFIIDFYYRMGKKYPFFNYYFNQLAGNTELKKQIIAGFNEDEIRITWYEGLKKYKEIRKKYLLYPDSN